MSQSHNPLTRLSRPMRRYLIIGISVYLFELVVIAVSQWLGASNILAVGLSFWLGLIVSFILQKTVTFEDKRTYRKVLIPQLLAFSLLVLFNFSFTLLVTQLLAYTVPAIGARTVALGITTIWNYYLYKTRIFKTSDSPVY